MIFNNIENTILKKIEEISNNSNGKDGYEGPKKVLSSISTAPYQIENCYIDDYGIWILAYDPLKDYYDDPSGRVFIKYDKTNLTMLGMIAVGYYYWGFNNSKYFVRGEYKSGPYNYYLIDKSTLTETFLVQSYSTFANNVIYDETTQCFYTSSTDSSGMYSYVTKYDKSLVHKGNVYYSSYSGGDYNTAQYIYNCIYNTSNPIVVNNYLYYTPNVRINLNSFSSYELNKDAGVYNAYNNFFPVSYCYYNNQFYCIRGSMVYVVNNNLEVTEALPVITFLEGSNSYETFSNIYINNNKLILKGNRYLYILDPIDLTYQSRALIGSTAFSDGIYSYYYTGNRLFRLEM